MTVTEQLPHWDVSAIFPSLDSDEFAFAFDEALSSITQLKELFDKHEVRKVEGVADLTSVEAVITAYNEVRERLARVQSYLSAFTSTDSRNSLAQSKASELESSAVELARLNTRLQAWVGSSDADRLIASSEVLRDHEFVLRKFRKAAGHQMSEAEEDLVTGLARAGSSAWSRLYRDVTSQLMVDYRAPNGVRDRLPMSTVRMMFREPDPEVRRAAYESELLAWETVEVPLAAALNGVKGEQNTLNPRRGWKDSLEPALFLNNLSPDTFEAMQSVCIESLPDFRRYLKAKARLIGKDVLAWWDLGAPVGTPRRWSYEEATQTVSRSYRQFSDRMGDLADRAFSESWIDAEPRPGKVDGAFCMSVGGGDSRVLTQFTNTYGSVNSLAHELGHAYHVLNLAKRTWLQRQTPMALSETASTFGEQILARHVLDQLKGSEKLHILDYRLASACQQIVDIYSRYLFERRVFEKREQREVSVSELKTFMADAQREAYGDAMNEDHLHPYLWAAKVHFFGTGYYNWPYSFGLLFGLGLYARYLEDQRGFPTTYDEVLSSTGMAEVNEIGRRLGMDFSSPDFWRASVALLRDQIDEFESLAGTK